MNKGTASSLASALFFLPLGWVVTFLPPLKTHFVKNFFNLAPLPPSTKCLPPPQKLWVKLSFLPFATVTERWSGGEKDWVSGVQVQEERGKRLG